MEFKNFYKVDDYLNNKGNGFYFRMIGDKSYISYILDRYAEAYPDKQDEINEIKNNFDKIYYSKITKDELNIILRKRIYEKNFEYLKIVYDLLFSSEESINAIFDKYNIDKKKYITVLKKFEKYYPNQDEEIHDLQNIYNQYLNDEIIANLDINIYIDKKTDFTDQELKLIDIYKSNYCIIEYCSKEELSYTVATNIVKKNQKSTNQYLNEMANDILSRDSSIIIDKLLNFANYIALNEDFDILDYLDVTRLSFVDFKNIIAPFVSREVSTTIFNRLKKLKNLNNHFSKNFELDSKTIIGGRVITREEKEKVFQYIEDNNYPIGVYQFVLRKYVNGDIDLGKVLVKK